MTLSDETLLRGDSKRDALAMATSTIGAAALSSAAGFIMPPQEMNDDKSQWDINDNNLPPVSIHYL